MPLTHLRLAQLSDIPALRILIEASVRRLQTSDYTPAQIEGALGSALGLDTQLIADQHYFIAEQFDQPSPEHASHQQGSPKQATPTPKLVGCGGWSNRQTLFGSDYGPHREHNADFLNPASDAARIRAIFVHPDHARQGIGTLILERCEAAAIAAGFRRFEMGSTLTGVPLYRLCGYASAGLIQVPLPNGESLPVLRMTRSL